MSERASVEFKIGKSRNNRRCLEKRNLSKAYLDIDEIFERKNFSDKAQKE